MWCVISNTMRYTEAEAPKYGIDIRDRETVLVVQRPRDLERRRLEVGDIILDLTIFAASGGLTRFDDHAWTWDIIHRSAMMVGAKVKQSESSHRLYTVVPRKCDTCDGFGRVEWMIEGDPNCYQERDSDEMIPCPDCGVPND